MLELRPPARFRNLARVALVWMDEYKDFYFKANPHAAEAAVGQNVTARLSLRRELQCKPFEWYLDTVWPENFFPTEGRRLGKFVHRQTGLCLQARRGAGQGRYL